MAAITTDVHNNNLLDRDEVDFVVSKQMNINTNNYNYQYKNINNNNNNNIDIKQCDYDEYESGKQEKTLGANTAVVADNTTITTTTTAAAMENVPKMMTQKENTTKLTTATTVPNSTNTNGHANGNAAPATPKQKQKKSLFTFSKNKSGSQKALNSKNKNAAAQQELQQQQQEQLEQQASAAATAEQNGQTAQTQQTANQNDTNGLTDAQQNGKPIGTLPNAPRQHKFVKSSSIARLLGNTYNAKKFEKAEQKRKAATAANDKKFHTYSAGQRRRRDSGAYLDRFKSSKDIDNADVLLLNHTSTQNSGDGLITLTTDTRELFANGTRNELVAKEKTEKLDYSTDLGSRAMRTLTRGLGKLWWKRSHSVDISAPDPEYKVSYLGNVLTGWAKGEGCVEKQLNTLWRNYTQNNKPDVIMRIKVCASGLKATTRQHGLTEYWANRITHCCAPKNYPRVFCWIYRHEGRKLKHELRCHAVLCSKEKIVQEICETLKENLETALREFKREKILKQNARLSLANAVYDNPSLPRRKILLSVGGNNYRPPLERSKSAPKLTAIEEAIGEEEGEEIEETNEPEMKPCCQKDSLYPAMTLGRRRCRRGHSIRRTGKVKLSFDCATLPKTKERCCGNSMSESCKQLSVSAGAESKQTLVNEEGTQRHSYGSDESDEFDKLLRHNNYDASATLSTELMPYFDMQLHKNTSCSLGSLSELKDHDEPLSLIQTINSDPSAHPNAEYDPSGEGNEHDGDADMDALEVPMVGLRRTGVCSDGEEDYLDEDDMYFRQNAILNMLHRNSMRKMAALNLSSDESSLETHANYPQHRHQAQSSICSNASSTATDASSSASTSGMRKQASNLDSDEGSISSGCETASTVTANQDDISFSYRQSKIDMQHNEYGVLDEEQPITVDDIYERLESRMQARNNSDATTFSSSSSITLKMGSSPNPSMQNGLDAMQHEANAKSTSLQRNKRTRKHATTQRNAGERSDDDTDSECSDESGYVEYQERAQKLHNKNAGNHNANTITTASATAVTKTTTTTATGNIMPTKPQLPPKPMPRRSLSIASTTTSV